MAGSMAVQRTFMTDQPLLEAGRRQTAPVSDPKRTIVGSLKRNKTHLGQWSTGRRNAISDEDAAKESIKQHYRTIADILELDRAVVPINMYQLQSLLKRGGLGEPVMVNRVKNVTPVLRFKKTVDGPNIGPRRRPSIQMILEARYRAETARDKGLGYDARLYPSVTEVTLDLSMLMPRLRQSSHVVDKTETCLPAINTRSSERTLAAWVANS